MSPGSGGAVRFVCSFFGIGFIPWAPATWASLAVAGIAWFLPSDAWVAGAIALSCAAGFSLCKPSREAFKSLDPHPFVLDEVAGMFISVLWLPKTLAWYAAAFVLFRVFDIWKPGFITTIQNNPHPSSIMWDDVSAGLVVVMILQLTRTITGG